MFEQEVLSLLQTHQTPFYLFDAGQLQQRVRFLQTLLPGQVELCYALKANPFLAREVSPLVARLELCSPGEYAICDQLDLPPGQFVISGVYKDPAWLQDLVARQGEEMIFTVESLQQFELLHRAAQVTGKKLSLLLRLTSGNQFGLEKDELENLFALHRHSEVLEIRGVQYFSGTQKTSLKRLARELGMLDEFLAHLHQRLGAPVGELEFGPGFPIDYFDRPDPQQEEAFLRQAAALFAQMNYRGKIVLELGRSIAATCGRYVTKVVDRKTNGSQNYAIVDGGIHQLVYYGQSLAMHRPPVTAFPLRQGEPLQKWNICGALCTINDLLVKQLPLPDLRLGDVLVFDRAGAYCMTEGIALFLSRDLPQILLRQQDGQIRTLRQARQIHFLNTPHYDTKEDI